MTVEVVYNLLGSTRGLGGAREDGERWRQEGGDSRQGPGAKARGVKRTARLGGGEQMRWDGQDGLDHHPRRP